MTAPDYVPLAETDRIRPSDKLSMPKPWELGRPGELRELVVPQGRLFGSTGPDLGYGMKLANRLADQLTVPAGESRHDAVTVGFVSGARRASIFGRAPVIHDMRWAYTIWGFLGPAPEELVAWRAPIVRGADHDYEVQRAAVDRIAPDSFRLTPDQAKARLESWKELFISES